MKAIIYIVLIYERIKSVPKTNVKLENEEEIYFRT
jgi:hypothetical protein